MQQQVMRPEIPKAVFERLVRQILEVHSAARKTKIRMQEQAMEALQTEAEAYLVSVFEDMNLLANHAHRVTIMSRDERLAIRLRRDPVSSDYRVV